eukprot:311120-Rhodomonas_salina.1
MFESEFDSKTTVNLRHPGPSVDSEKKSAAAMGKHRPLTRQGLRRLGSCSRGNKSTTFWWAGRPTCSTHRLARTAGSSGREIGS